MNNLLDGEADLSDVKFTDAPVPEHLWLRDGDVLFNRTNSWEHVGRTGIWRGQIETATFASYLVRLHPHPDKLLPEMLNSWLKLGTDSDRYAPTSHARSSASEHQSDESSFDPGRVPEELG